MPFTFVLNGTIKTATPPLVCGAYSCAAIDATHGKAVFFNQTHSEYLDTTKPVRTVSTNGKSFCTILAASVDANEIVYNHHLECFGAEASFSTTETQYHMVGLGEFHICGILRGTFQYLDCRGDNRWGQLMFPEDIEFIDVSSSWTHSCGVDQLYNGHCWGYLPAQISMPVGLKYKMIASGRGYSCGILSDDT